MSSTRTTINLITIYGGFPIFICGTVGNLINMHLFWKKRQNPCAFIFLVLSFTNCIVLFYGIFLRILSVGFQLDWSTTSLAWCKTRAVLASASILISLSLSCLGSIDRFLMSCREEKYRKLSRLPFTILAVIVIIILWIGHFSPSFFYANIIRNPVSGVLSCTTIQYSAYTNYILYFGTPFFYGFLPGAILTITGIMTYRNTKKLQAGHQRELIQKQLTSMMLVQIPIILVSTLPFVILTVYTLFTATVVKSTDRIALEQLLMNISTVLSYVTFACPFFVFIVSSRSFRDEVKALVVICYKATLFRMNQVHPN